MADLEDSISEFRETSAPFRTLICMNIASLGFLRSEPALPKHSHIDIFQQPCELFDRLWHEPESVATIVLDSCPFNLEEVYYASLNHTHVTFVVRSPDLDEEPLYKKFEQRPNVRLPCTDFMVWSYAFPSEAIRFGSSVVE